MVKTAKNAGADERTPSVPQYFSWINNTNEGATEQHTLINLDFFKYLKDTYGMQIKIYALDAGNFDGASEGYGNLQSEKFRTQYPEEYKNIVAKAKDLGIRLGIWGSPDGFGDDEKTQQERFDFFVHLCRDHNFALFKLDGVCGRLRPEKAGIFTQMLKECRKYVPDLIVLNHRLNFYDAEKYSTTYLWNGVETYVDVSSHNKNTAMHNRAFMFERGHTNNLERLAEDHGVCISSAIDYFEDELIYQAFNRSLILAPEIYGNPWLIRDDELAKLARIYNLHARNAAILVDGTVLPDEYGCNAVSRGSNSKRFISTGNNSWETKTITVKIGEETGIVTDEPIAVNLHHPYEKHLGIFNVGDEIKIELMPFRAALIELAAVSQAEPMLKDCEYEIIKEDEKGNPIEVRYLTEETKEKAPVYLGSLDCSEARPKNSEYLYETAMFAISNDSLESRSLRRSGETSIPQVKAARDAFFEQKHYLLRGCESKFMFDGKDDTFFDGHSKLYRGQNMRINGGCLRIDFGKVIDCDSVEIEFFSADCITDEVSLQCVPLTAEYSADLHEWKYSETVRLDIADDDFTSEIVRFKKHTTYDLHGKKIVSSYKIEGKVRYLRIEKPVDRIYAVRLIKDGKPIEIDGAFANNMQSHYRHSKTSIVCHQDFVLPEYKNGARLAVAVEGEHGDEGVYCVAEFENGISGFPRRAPDYKANHWEQAVRSTSSNNTFFMDIPENMAGKKVRVYAMFNNSRNCENSKCNVYLCDKH